MKLILITITCLGLATQLKGQNLFSRFFGSSCYPQCDPLNSVCKYSYSRNVYFCECLHGYGKNSQGKCVDIDECRRRPNPCSFGTTCINTVGSFSCQCQPGYEYIGNACVDINECKTAPFLCHPNTCLNTPGSYKCGCGSGYELKGGVCIDINECLTSPCPTNSICTNTVGGFKCQCKNGFQLKHGVCSEINKCLTSPCPTNSICTNTVRGFKCQCKNGFQLKYGVCTDINECNKFPNPCHSNSRCENTAGSFKCACKIGFYLRNGQCTNINECRSTPCARHATCTDTVGSYTCKCRNGYYGDGKKQCILIRVAPKPKAITRPPTTTPNVNLCKGLPRNWSKCKGNPPIRFTLDKCAFKFENCSDGTVLGRLFVDNFLGPNVDEGGNAGGGDNAGQRSLNLFEPQSLTTPSPTNSSCQIRHFYNSKGELLTGTCVKTKKRSKRSAIPQIVQTKRDLLIMLDESGSVGHARYEKVKRIAAAIVRLLCERIKVNLQYTRVAITTFNRKVYFPVKLESVYSLRYLDQDAERLAQYIFDRIYYHGGYDASETCLIQALDHAYYHALDAQNGGRRGDVYVEQDIIIISDGCENCVPENQRLAEIERVTSSFIQQGIHVYVIGVGLKQACRETLALLAQGGRCFHFFYLSTWDYELDKFIEQLENPPPGVCLNIFEKSQGQCLSPF